MIDIFVLIFYVMAGASVVWVYFDATNSKIGKIPDESGLFNMHAGMWALAASFLWLVIFPAYLIKRKSLIEKAKVAPINVKSRQTKLTIFAVLGVIPVVFQLTLMIGGGGYVLEGVDDKINGNTLTASKQEESANGILVSDVALICALKNKKLSLQITSYFTAKEDEIMQSALFQMENEHGISGLGPTPVGKIKFG